MENEFERWMTLVNEAKEALSITQKVLSDRFSIDKRERYEINYDEGEITFIDNNVTVVKASFNMIGSISYAEGTWLWSWANPHVSEHIKADAITIKEYGIENQIDTLLNSEFSADENDGWLMASIASFIVKADGVWLSPFNGGVSYFCLKDVRQV